jgi:hypothetical protein
MENQLRKKQQTKEYKISEIEISANNKDFDGNEIIKLGSLDDL